MTLRLGTLCRFENPSDEAGRALIRQFVLVREADRMGYDDIWLAERHGDALRPSAAITTLLGHLAGVTSKARIGAVLQPLGRDAVQLAEDLATVGLLSRGRLALAVDAQQAHGADAQDGAYAVRALAGLRRRLAEAPTDLVPRPEGACPPGWAVADGAQAVRAAAAAGLGLWLPETLVLDAVAPLLAQYREAAGSDEAAALALPLLARHVCPAATREEALAIARPYLQALCRQQEGVQAGDAAAVAEAVLAQSLVGSHAEVAAEIRRLAGLFGLHGMVLVPMSAHFDTAKHILADLVDEVRPLLDD